MEVKKLVKDNSQDKMCASGIIEEKLEEAFRKRTGRGAGKYRAKEIRNKTYNGNVNLKRVHNVKELSMNRRKTKTRLRKRKPKYKNDK